MACSLADTYDYKKKRARGDESLTEEMIETRRERANWKVPSTGERAFLPCKGRTEDGRSRGPRFRKMEESVGAFPI